MKKLEEYRIQLIETIIEERLKNGVSVNFDDAKIEATIILNFLIESSISKEEEANNIYMDISVKSAIYSYKMMPTLNINYRIPFINGVSIGTQIIATMESKNMATGKSLQEKNDIALSIYEGFKKGTNLGSTPKYDEIDGYTKLGITNVIEIMHNDNNKVKQNKNGDN